MHYFLLLLLGLSGCSAGGSTGIQLEDCERGPGCFAAASLAVSGAGIRSNNEPLVRRAREGDCQIASFALGWAEAKEIRVRLEGSVFDVRAAYHTDYGDFPGEVDLRASRAHRHDKSLCIDLWVVRKDGSDRREHWQCQFELDDWRFSAARG